MGKEDGKVTLGADDLKALISQAVSAGITEGLKMAGAGGHAGERDLSPDHSRQVQSILDGLRPKADPTLESRVRAKSPDEDGTGATFVAVVAKSATHPRGRVVRFEDYTHPPDLHTRIPDGMDKRRNDSGQYMDAKTKQWIWTTFWQADLKRFIGRPLPTHAVVADHVDVAQAT